MVSNHTLKKVSLFGLATLITLLPLSAIAAPTLKEIVDGPISRIGNLLITLLYALAFLFFIFGMFNYYFGVGKNAEENRQKGRQFMLWSIIGLVVLFTVWGIVKMFLRLLESWA